MADVSSIHNAFVDDSDEGFVQGDCPLGNAKDEAALTPLMRIQKYAQSSEIYLRHKVAKAVLEEFQTWPPETLIDDLPEIMKILVKMEDESISRVELLEQIPHIAAQAIERSSRVPAFKTIVSEHLIPLVVRSLGCNTQIIHSTLIQLIEQGFISKLQAEIQICPTILALTKLETAADVNTCAIILMSKLAPLLGRDVTERVFLGRFTELCSSPMFPIRKACAALFGNFATVISNDAVEKILVPKYLTLTADDVWGVRMTCAEVVTYISCACSANTRNTKLSPAFGALLKDDERWVRIAAFKSLGPFISTFADPPITKMIFSHNRDLVLVNGEGAEFMVSTPTPFLTYSERYEDEISEMVNAFIEESHESGDSSDKIGVGNDVESFDKKANVDNGTEKETIADPKSIPNVIVCDNISEKINELTDEMQNIKLIENNTNLDNANSTNINKAHSQLNSNATTEDKITNTNKDTNDNEKKVNINNNGTIEDDLHLFYSHNYWYISPELPLDPNLVGGDECQSVFNGAGDVTLPENNLTEENKPNNNNSTISIDEKDVGIDDTGEKVLEAEDPKPPQNIVPQVLVDHYIAMAYPALSLNIDNEMAYDCAYFFPAVVLTLGRENWHLLEDTIFTLAADMQYKVRRAVASSLHEIAIILGTETATNSLTRLFEGFIKDLDEVRIGILKHLAAFLKVITPVKRNKYLPRLAEFVQTDNEWNWRFREELVKQLLEAMELFKPSDISKYVGGIAIVLLCDKVAAVREAALSLVTEIISYTSSEPNLVPGLLIKLAETFAHSKKWKRRQTFCLMCIELLKEEALEPEQFVSEVMPHLLDLSWDPVANVRLVVARCLSRYILNNLYFVDLSSDHCDGFETVLRRLQADKDSDVRQSAEV